MNEFEWQLLEDKTRVDQVEVVGGQVRAGDRVRLRPHTGGDVMDIALAGQIATVEAIEQDYEGKSHICVVVDNDPGRDLGMLRQPGHRFFFDPSEVEVVPLEEIKPAPKKARVLIAGIGNIFLGDDGFGVEVTKRLLQRGITEGVKVVDFGIRGLDLAYALQDNYEAVILVDAYPHGKEPGALYVVEPDLETIACSSNDSVVDAHGTDPLKVLTLVGKMGGQLKNILLVGCEPATFGGEEGQMGLSAQVEAAVDSAVQKIDLLAAQLLRGEWPDQKSEPSA